MQKRVVIIGGVAGGATVAARMMRVDSPNTNVTVLERGPDVSFANCGLPYFIGGEITDRSNLLLHTPESLKKAIGVNDVRIFTEGISIDRVAKVVKARNVKTGVEEIHPYDSLVLSPGASPFVPPVPGAKDPRVMSLRNMQDMDAMVAAFKSPSCKRVAVIGAGFIGLEMVEQLHRIKKEVTLVEMASAVLPQADTEMAAFLHSELNANKINHHIGDGLKAFEAAPDGALRVVLVSGAHFDADAVVLCIGVRPDNQLAKEANLELSPRGLIRVNSYMQSSDPSIYAVGDVVETPDPIFPDQRAWVALGNVANMQARIAADHALATPEVASTMLPYKGSYGTSIVRLFGSTLALTGWTEKRLKAAGIPYSATIINASHHAGYYPNAETMTIKITYDPVSGKVYGGQAVGGSGVDKRIDVIATAIKGGLTVEDLSQLQLTYSPPFGSAKDAVNLAGLAARNELSKTSVAIPSFPTDDRIIIDVRPASSHKANPFPAQGGGKNIYFADLHTRLGELDKSKKYTAVCDWGRTAYFGQRTMRQAGFDCNIVSGGWRVQKMRDSIAAIERKTKKGGDSKL